MAESKTILSLPEVTSISDEDTMIMAPGGTATLKRISLSNIYNRIVAKIKGDKFNVAAPVIIRSTGDAPTVKVTANTLKTYKTIHLKPGIYIIRGAVSGYGTGNASRDTLNFANGDLSVSYGTAAFTHTINSALNEELVVIADITTETDVQFRVTSTVEKNFGYGYIVAMGWTR